MCEMQTVFSRIWTRIVVSISYDNNHCDTEFFTVSSSNFFFFIYLFNFYLKIFNATVFTPKKYLHENCLLFRYLGASCAIVEHCKGVRFSQSAHILALCQTKQILIDNFFLIIWAKKYLFSFVFQTISLTSYHFRFADTN